MLLPDNSYTGPALAYLQSFVDWLQRKAEEVKLTVITTNYDIAVERAMFERQCKRVRTRLNRTSRGTPDEDTVSAETHRQIAREMDFGFSWRHAWNGPNTTFDRPRKEDCRLHWYKLHGSFNWLLCDLCGQIYINADSSIVDLAFTNKKSPDVSCHCGHFPLRPVLVTPSFVRDVRDSNLLEIWRHSFEALRESTRWTFIGYSFPEEDIAIRSMLVRAYHGRESPPQIEVVTLSTSDELSARVEAILPCAKVTIGGAEKFVSLSPHGRR